MSVKVPPRSIEKVHSGRLMAASGSTRAGSGKADRCGTPAPTLDRRAPRRQRWRMADENKMEAASPPGAGGFPPTAQKQIRNGVFAVLADSKMDWALVEPFLQAARE